MSLAALEQNRNHRQYLLFQVWDAQQRLLYKNAGAPDRAFAAPAGADARCSALRRARRCEP